MKKLLVLTIALFLASPVTTALAVPRCDGPPFDELDRNGRPIFDEQTLAQEGEMRLRQMGIDANDTRFWNGCLQTFVRDANGHETIRYFDPDSYREIPVN